MKINEKLIWDYKFSEAERRGGIEDIRCVGLDVIHNYLPQVSLQRAQEIEKLPRRLKEFFLQALKEFFTQFSKKLIEP